MEMVDSVDDPKSSRSIKGTHGPDFGLLDARIPSALKGQSGGTKKPRKDRVLRGRQIAYLI